MYRFIFVLLISLASFLFSQNLIYGQKNSFKEQILGKWEGTGSLFGNSASFMMEWKSILNDEYLQLNFQNQFGDKTGASRTMTAKGYYLLSSNIGQWFDSRGIMLPLTFELHDNTLKVFWGDHQTEKGKTEYTLQADEKLFVKDYVFKNDGYVLFGEAVYNKNSE